MTKYAYAERVTKKVAKLLKYNKSAIDCMQGTPQIQLDENFCLSCLYWNYYDDSLTVNSNGITLKRFYTQEEKLITYNSFDELLKL